MISRCPSCGNQVDDEALQCPKCYWDFAKFKRVPPPGAAPAKEEAPSSLSAKDFTPEPELPASAFAPAPSSAPASEPEPEPEPEPTPEPPLPPPVQLPPIGNFSAQEQGLSLPAAAPQPQGPSLARPDESGGLALPQFGKIAKPAPRAQGPTGIPLLPVVPPPKAPGSPPFASGRPIGASASPPPLKPVSEFNVPAEAPASSSPFIPKAAGPGPKLVQPPAEKKAPPPLKGLLQTPAVRPAKSEQPPLTVIQSGGGWGSVSPPKPPPGKPKMAASATMQPKPGRGRSPVLNRVTAGVVIAGVIFVVATQIVMRPDVQVRGSGSSLPAFAKDSRPQPLQLPAPSAQVAPEPAAADPLPSVAQSSPAAAPVEPARTAAAPAVEFAPAAPVAPASPEVAPKPPPPSVSVKTPPNTSVKAPAKAKPRARRIAPAWEDEGPRWVFEGSVYDIISLRAVSAATLAFKDASGRVRGEATTAEDGSYSVSLEPLSDAAYVMAVRHADYQAKYIDEIQPPFKEVSLSERRQLVSMAARARPWVGKPGLSVRRDLVMIPKDLAKGGPESPAVPGE